MDLMGTIKPKSDQLNADDLIAGPITVTILNVTVKDSEGEQPVVIDIDGGHKPYKPCKLMRRVMVRIWGKDGKSFIGKRARLFYSEGVMFGKDRVGGIRISHMSGITEPVTLILTVGRGRRVEYTVQPFAMYPAQEFADKLPAIKKAIAENKITAQQAIERCRKVGELTDEMVKAIE